MNIRCTSLSTQALLAVLCGAGLLFPSFCHAQSTAKANSFAADVTDPQASSIVQQAQLALTGGNTINAISLNATATWIAGGTHETGSADLKAKGSAEARLDVAAGSFMRSEVRNDTSNPAGEWMDSNGAAHRFAQHNCWSTAAWFSPISLLAWAQQPDVIQMYVGREVRDGAAVDHVRLYRVGSDQSRTGAEMFRRLTTEDLFVAADSHLPVALIFDTHPDNDMNRDIPVEIRYTDYRSINGVQVPFHIQRLFQNTLNLNLIVTSAVPNVGIPDSDFALQ